LGGSGLKFRDALCDYIAREGRDYLANREKASSLPQLNTGTSKTGLSSYKSEIGLDGKELPFPLLILSSTMPRAVQTVLWDQLQFPIEELSNLNPLDKGDYAGLELAEIRNLDPEFYALLEADPFNTR
jgi:hypothetical protein